MIQKIHDNHLCCGLYLASQFHKLSTQFSFLKTTLYLFPSLIWPKVEQLDVLGGGGLNGW